MATSLINNYLAGNIQPQQQQPPQQPLITRQPPPSTGNSIVDAIMSVIAPIGPDGQVTRVGSPADVAHISPQLMEGAKNMALGVPSELMGLASGGELTKIGLQGLTSLPPFSTSGIDYNPLLNAVPNTTDKFGNKLGANTASLPFLLGAMGIPDPKDIGKVAYKAGEKTARLGRKATDVVPGAAPFVVSPNQRKNVLGVQMPPPVPAFSTGRTLHSKVATGEVRAGDYWVQPPVSSVERQLSARLESEIAAGNAPKSISGVREIAESLAGDIEGTTWTKAALSKEADRLVKEGKFLLPEEPRALEVTNRVFTNGPKTQQPRTNVLNQIYSGAPPVTNQRGYGETSFKMLKRAGESTSRALVKADDAGRNAIVDDSWQVLEGTYEIKRPINPKTGKPAGNETALLAKNAKMLKAEAGFKGKGVNEPTEPLVTPDGDGVETTGLSLYQAYEEPKMKICANSKSCKDSCLGITAGGNRAYGGGADAAALKGPRLSHFLKTQALLRDPEAFLAVLDDEVGKALVAATKRGNILGVRLNVLSDVPPETYGALMDRYPNVDFFDYTKLHGNKPIRPNHHITYSSTGVSDPNVKWVDEDGVAQVGVVNPHQNWRPMIKKLDEGFNVAMPFAISPADALPKFVKDEVTGKSYHVIDGDIHDFRPGDEWNKAEGADGVIVGLRNKSQNANQKGNQGVANTGGFFTRYDPETMGDTVVVTDQASKAPKASHGNAKSLATIAAAAAFAGEGYAEYEMQFPHFEDYNPEFLAELQAN